MSCKKIFKIAEEEGIDLGKYISIDYKEANASIILSALRNGIDPTPMCDITYSLDKIIAIKTAMENGIDYTPLLECNDNYIAISRTLRSILQYDNTKEFENLANAIVAQAADDIRSKSAQLSIKDKESAKQFFTKGTKKYDLCKKLTGVDPCYIKRKLVEDGAW